MKIMFFTNDCFFSKYIDESFAIEIDPIIKDVDTYANGVCEGLSRATGGADWYYQPLEK